MKNTTLPSRIEALVLVRKTPKVVFVLECSVCRKRRYFSRNVNLVNPLKFYCGNCKTARSFEVIPFARWDDRAKGIPNGSSKHLGPAKQG
jgi:hypothetical protein